MSWVENYLKGNIPSGPSVFDQMYETPWRLRDELLSHPIQLALKYGEVYKMPGMRGEYVATSPASISHVLKDRADNFRKQHMIWKRLSILLGKSMICHEVDDIGNKNIIVNKAFQKDSLKLYADIIQQKLADYLPRLEHMEKTGQSIDLLNDMGALTLQIVSQAFLSEKISFEQGLALNRAVNIANQQLVRTLIILPWWPSLNNLKFQWQLKKINEFFQQIIDKRHTSLNDAPQDLLQLLLQAKTAQFTEQDVFDEVKGMILAGYETISHALTWAWIELAKNPVVLAQLRDEVRALNEPIMGHSQLPQLKFTKNILKESLRLYPPLWSVLRTSKEADMIGKYYIPDRTAVRLHFYALHHNPLYWPQAEHFNPNRFEEQEIVKNSFLPFGVGPRACKGYSVAYIQGQLILATIAQHFDLQSGNPLPIKAEPYVTLQPSRRYRVKVLSV